MPLVRVKVKSEFGLGKSELYREANCEDPKAVLDGVAVAGLVGILRQLGDLAEFAGEVFHGLQEQVMTTASRSHNVMVRVKQIEAALPSLEKAILAQTSHIHFAYTAGSEWHPRIQAEQNHFIYHDLPRFIMDDYEECRDPPQLHLLDKFDTGGPGSCLKRYSDPTFFRRKSKTSGKTSLENVRSDKKAHKVKRKRSLVRNEEVLYGSSVSDPNGSLQFPSLANQGTSISQTASTVEAMPNADAGDCSNSFDSGTGLGYIEHVHNLGSSMQPQEQKFRESPRSSSIQFNDNFDTVFPDERSGIIHDKFQHALEEQTAYSSCHVMWDEKVEIVEPSDQQGIIEKAEIVEARSQQDDVEVVEIMEPRSQQDDIEAVEIMETRSQRDDIEAVEIIEPRSQRGDREKAETVEPRSQQGDREEEKVFIPKSTLDAHEKEAFYLRNDGKMNMLVDNGHTLESIYHRNEFDDFESETDNYMDALNTIESESETDPDCQTKREVEPCSSNVNCEAADPVQDLLESSLDSNMQIINTTSEPHNSSDKQIVSGLPDLDSSDSFYDDQRLENTGNVSSPDCTLVTDLHETKSSMLESDASESFPSDSTTFSPHDPSGIKFLSRLHESEKTSNFSISHSDKFWTNGGLLGLQPSKPPSWAVSSAGSEDSCKEDKYGLSDHALVVNGNAQDMKMGILHKNAVKNERDSTPINSSMRDDQKDDTSGNQLRTSPSQLALGADLNVKNDSFNISHINIGSSHAHTNDLVTTSARLDGTASQVVPNVNITCPQTRVGKDENSNHISGISLLINGFHRKLKLHDERFETATSMNTDVPEKRTALQNDIDKNSLIDSLPSSPPIDHMKISFHPVCGFEISKLKLKFPDGNEGRGSMKDIFPSFQLAPEESISVHEIGSDSDDDTFCRSSPCRSDDCLSDRSKSNSDLWESDDTPGSKGHSLYDLCQISQMGSFSTSFELEGIPRNDGSVDGESRNLNNGNGMDESLSCPVLDLPSFDIVNPVMSGRIDDADAMDLPKLQCSDNLTPAPPPLPPAQWRVLKASLDAPEDQKDLSSHPEHMQSIVSQQQITYESIATKPITKKEGKLMVNEQKESNHAGNDKMMDDREDFLQQIRAKSFNLRRTVTEKPSTTSGPTTHVKVTAILEKANAIRQAVGSDNGEDDDSWSDA